MKGLVSKKGGGLDNCSPLSNNCTDGEINTPLRYENYVPLDFIKAKLIDVDIDHLKSVLNFSQPVNTDSGEIVLKRYPDGSYKESKRYAQWYNMNFTIQYSNMNQCEFVIVEGSIHKFSNKGVHNHNDFTIESFAKVLRAFKLFLRISPSDLFIYQLEWGVNVLSPIETNTILNHCLLFHWEKFKNPLNNYVQGGNENNYLLKLYNKGYQFNLNNGLMRIERKQIDWNSYCKQQGIGRTLKDLILSDFKGLREHLIENWQDVIFFDPEVKESSSKVLKLRDVFYWLNLKKNKTRTTLSNKRNKLHKINKEFGNDTQAKITNLIIEKIKQLNNERFTLSELVYTLNLSTSSTRIINTHYGLTG